MSANQAKSAQGAGIDDPFRSQPLEGSHRLAVVTILGVVVVLDYDGGTADRLFNELLPALGNQRASCRKLMGRSP
jgi:hypothetical protein